MQIFAGDSSWRGRQTTVGLSITAIFGDFDSYFFGNFIELRPALLYGDKQSVAGL